ncbi:MAG TPA: VWA domain-containing protein, partial [Edaphobacter sp.]|nr:VWA domain-containing protein [Edaphobacter sp.]
MLKPIPAACLLLLSTTGWCQSTTPASTQQPTQDTQPITTLKVAARVVEISAVVKSKGGEHEGGLTKDDFILKQDGKPQPIRYFSRGSDLPLTLALMVDTSGSQRTFINDEALASDVFFETMMGRKQDRAMLVQFDVSVQQLQGMTNSPNILHLALTRLSSHASAANGTLLNDAVYSVAKNILAKEAGRKAIVLLTDGGENGSRSSLADAIEQVQRADVQVYSILYSAQNEAAKFGVITGTSDPGMKLLQSLSEATGGRVFTVSPTLSLREIYAQISQDLRLQYALAYTPPADTQPNSYHKLELKAKNNKLTVQARKGFFAA